MRRGVARRVATAATAAVLLAGCATQRPPASNAAEQPIAGRLAVRVAADGREPARSVSAGFELGGDERAGRLDLSTPFGTTLARARWSPGSVVLVTPQGETAYPDLASLTRDVLGEELPVAALFDWLRGRPWPGAPSTPLEGEQGPGFEQLGWRVGLGRHDEGIVVATRAQAPAVTVQVRLERETPAAAGTGVSR